MTPITVLIAENDPDYRAALEELVRQQPSLRLVASARDADEAVDLSRLRRPQVAVVDVRMPAGGGPRVARDLGDALPDTKVLALSAYDDPGTVAAMLDAGAVAYVLKGASGGQIVQAIRDCAVGRLDPQLRGVCANDGDG